MVKIIECPRDAMQGIKPFIATDTKVAYINQLLKVGFDTIDFGSFVSPKAIPQMRDTAEVLSRLDLSGSKSKLLAIIANTRGAEEACKYTEITYLGFPLSISETFQQRNTNKSIDASFQQLAEIQDLCFKHNKTLVVYLSMGFGNPYGDPYNTEVLSSFCERLQGMKVEIVALSDTIGSADVALIDTVFRNIIPAFPSLEIGAHLHSLPAEAEEKAQAAYAAGCLRFDGALKGFGGCPMAKDDLTGNMPTEIILETLKRKTKIDYSSTALYKALEMSTEVFPD